MTAKFTKLHEINLEDSEVEEGIPKDTQETDNGAVTSDSDNQYELSDVELVLEDSPQSMARWKIWRRWRGSYQLRRGTKRCLSFKAVLIASIIFAITILVSVLIARLATEPPEESQKQGKFMAEM